MDGQKGLLLAARTLWPTTKVQRCQFHVISFVTHYTGRRPTDPPARAILDILYRLKDAKTRDEKETWIARYREWERVYEPQFSMRTGVGGYTYPRLRSVRFIIRKALPYLFTFLDHPHTPNTTNLVEGWVNSAVAEALGHHRGLTELEKKTLVSVVLTHLKRQNPA